MFYCLLGKAKIENDVPYSQIPDAYQDFVISIKSVPRVATSYQNSYYLFTVFSMDFNDLPRVTISF